MPPGPIQTRWFEASFSGIPWRENLDGSVLAHTEGREEILPAGTQIQNLRMSGPLDGAPNAPAAGHTLCRLVPLSGCSGWL
jgi:hypothetical protein